MRRNGMIWAATALLVSLAPVALWAAEPASSAGDYGVSLAISGEEARAESLFITMLSHTRGDSRALNNLGNIRLLKGETGVALAFYERALRGDSLDPGIHLNRATALMLIGDKDRSAESFARGVKLAGGVDQAEALLGLGPERTASDRTASDRTAGDRAAKKTMIDPEQLRQMLRTAAKTVPTESAVAVNRTARTAKTASTWRSAGPRGADGSDTSHLLYWKR